MAMTGHPAGCPILCPVPLAGCADACLEAFRLLSGVPVLAGVTGAQLLAERAAITGTARGGAVSPGGSCRLLSSRNGRVGVNLPRPEDWELLPAWLQAESPFDWEALAARVAARTTEWLVARGRELGLAVVDATAIPEQECSWFRLVQRGVAANAAPSRAPRVLDLSSLWAGPLCSHLWQRAGADVTKVESTRRPDGARSGHTEFFALLNGGKRSQVLDLHTSAGQETLLQMIPAFDIVLEGSRPRALRQMGIVAEDLLAAHPGLSWVSITGFGRREPRGNWVAYGDDAGIAAGLSAILYQVTGQWLICADAVADPLTGLHAALAGWASWLAGGGHLIELSLEQTVRHCITATAPTDNDYRERQAQWSRFLLDHDIAPLHPYRRSMDSSSAP